MSEQHSERGTSDSRLEGVLVQADSISGDGEHQAYGEFVVCLNEDIVDIRLGDRKNTIWTLPLPRIKEAIRTLERWKR